MLLEMKNELKEKGIELLKTMKVHPNVIEDYKNGVINSSEFNGALYHSNNTHNLKIAELAEKGVEVVHIIECTYRMGDDETMKFTDYLIVTKEDLEEEREFLPEFDDEKYGRQAYTFTINHSWGNGEFGYIGIKNKNGGLARTY